MFQGNQISVLACPACKSPFEDQSSGLFCSACDSEYVEKSGFWELTHTQLPSARGLGPRLMNQRIIAKVYEGFWRPAFVTVATGRPPNRDAEFEQACRYLCGGIKALQDDAPVVDLSCGPGLFARHLIESESFRHVYALDLSEPMVKQCVKLGEHLRGELCVIRGDVHELPFQDGQVAAVHAGAAFHMWPSPRKAVDEVFRILRPGGVFVASTFVHAEGRRLSKAAAAVFERSTNTTVFDRSKLRDMLSEAGFEGFEETRRGLFSLFRVHRPL